MGCKKYSGNETLKLLVMDYLKTRYSDQFSEKQPETFQKWQPCSAAASCSRGLESVMWRRAADTLLTGVSLSRGSSCGGCQVHRPAGANTQEQGEAASASSDFSQRER